MSQFIAPSIDFILLEFANRIPIVQPFKGCQN